MRIESYRKRAGGKLYYAAYFWVGSTIVEIPEVPAKDEASARAKAVAILKAAIESES